jgi:hypothetical protein
MTVTGNDAVAVDRIDHVATTVVVVAAATAATAVSTETTIAVSLTV